MLEYRGSNASNPLAVLGSRDERGRYGRQEGGNVADELVTHLPTKRSLSQSVQ